MPKRKIVLMNKMNHGFSLIELIIVIAILAILSALAIPAVSSYLDNSTAQTNAANAKTIYEAANAYFAGNHDAVDGDLTTAALADTDKLITEMYLAKAPLTAEGHTYGVTSINKVVTVTWAAETDLAAENPTGTAHAVDAILTYPAP